MKKICLLGATGSIGMQTIDVCRKAGYELVAVTAGSKFEKLLDICREFKPKHVALYDRDAFINFNKEKEKGIRSYQGTEGIVECIRQSGADIVVNAIVGGAGILPTLAAVETANRVALANKESLVAAGNLIMSKAKEKGCEIIPIDSEHCAIFQCIDGSEKYVNKIYLTASGGPFRGYNSTQLEKVTPQMALKHPNWSMGPKITIDSATLMNKGLEVIEAHWLFGTDYNDIEVVVHPQSIIHSMVEMKDGSIIAQLGAPDMRLPIQYALTYPARMKNDFKRLDIFETARLDFEKPDIQTFRCLSLAYEAGRTGGTMPCAMNAANEEAVAMFLEGLIGFTQISHIVEWVMQKHNTLKADSIEILTEVDSRARACARKRGER